MGELPRLGWVRRDGSPLPSNECGVVIAFYICTSNANPSAPVRPVLQLSKGYCLDLKKNCVALGKSEVVKTCHSGRHLPRCTRAAPSLVCTRDVFSLFYATMTIGECTRYIENKFRKCAMMRHESAFDASFVGRLYPQAIERICC
jgi:hypothetical protein